MEPYPTAYPEFISLFNTGRFFEAHDVLEAEWRLQGGTNPFYKGLIQCAVVFYHLKNSNHIGALALLKSCQTYLTPFIPQHQGLNVSALCASLRNLEKQLQTPSDLSLKTLPTIALDFKNTNM
jgi:predicted metal-dependent hydrolase